MTRNAGGDVEASVGQRLLWLLGHYRGREGALNVPLAARLTGALDLPALQRAVDDVVDRHEALRTTYESKGRRLMLRVHPPRALPLTVADLSDAPRARAAVMTALTARASEAIDPREWPIQGWLWRVRPDEHVLLLSVHHLSADATSHLVIVRDLAALYDRARGLDAVLPDAGWPYSRWAAWQRETLADGVPDRWHAYWKRQLHGARPVAIAIAPLRPSAGGRVRATRSARCSVKPELVGALRALGAERRATLPAVTLAIFYALLAQRSGDTDLVVASLFGHRPRPEVRRTVGFFVTMLLLRARIQPEQGFGALVEATRRVLIEALQHRDLPYHMLPAGTLAGAGGRSVDDVVFQFIDAFGAETTQSGLGFEALPLRLNEGRFALELVVALNEGDCFVNLRYDDRRCDRTWARAFVRDYVELARRLATEPDRSLEDSLWPTGPR